MTPAPPTRSARLRARVRRLVLGVLLLSPLQASGQFPRSGPQIPNFDVDWRWVEFGPDDGVAQAVRELVSAGGVPWIRTSGDIAFYDGFHWTRPPVPTSFSGPVNFLWVAPDSSVLVTANGRAYGGDEEGLAEVALPLDTNQTLITAIPTPLGLYAVLRTTEEGSARTGLWHLGDDGFERVGATRAQGRAWATRDHMFWIWLGDRFQRLEPDGTFSPLPYPFRQYDVITGLVEADDRTGYMYINQSGTSRSLVHFGPDGVRDTSSIGGVNALLSSAITADGRTGMYLFDTGDVMGRVDSDWTRLDGLTRQIGFGISMIWITENDGELNYWFASGDRLHLYRASLNRWSPIREEFPSSRNRVHELLVHSNTQMPWQATAGGLNWHTSSLESRWFTEIEGLDVSVPTGLAEAADGSVWVGSGATFHGVLRYDGRWRHLADPESVGRWRVHRILAEPDSTVWFVGQSPNAETQGGVARWHPRTGFEDWGAPRGLVDARYYDVVETDSHVWTASTFGIERVPHGADRPDLSVRVNGGVFDLAVDSDGRIWMARHPTGDFPGLVYLDDESEPVVEVLPGGTAAQQVWNVEVGPDGTLWAGTAAGPARRVGDTWVLMGSERGLDARGVWPIEFTETGVLFGTFGSGVWHLSAHELDNPPPRVVFDRVPEARGETLVTWRPFSYWGSVPSEDIETRYRLDGGEWSDWSTEREVRLTGLSPGVRTLEVDALGLWGERRPSPARIEWTVPPPILLQPIVAAPLGALLASLILVVGYNVFRRREQALALARGARRLRTLVESAPEAIGLLDARANRFIDANGKASTLFGLTPEKLFEVDPFSLSDEPDSSAQSSRMVQRALSGETVTRDWTVRSSKGERIPCELHLSLLDSAEGDLLRMSLVDRRQERQAASERAELEAQLRQAQKLEAVGKLTGGIAHDFNNLLTVIQGNLDLLKSRSEGWGEDDIELIEAATKSADRSAQLTGQLLAFSRKQALAPKSVGLRELLGNMRSLLERTLGEHITVTLDVDVDLDLIRIDAGGLENAILNLAINSRDAMPPEGGTLTIRAHNEDLTEDDAALLPEVEAGRYVCVEVSDDGPGMAKEIAERAFDPFFTTKEVGKGSGLGLSMVYGFARQSGGTVQLLSAVGSGTTVRLYLPSTGAPAGVAPAPAPEESDDVPRGDGEHVLVVEDDEAVRKLVVTVLTRLGYRTHAVENGHDAIAYLESDAPIDLLLSDIVLPGGIHGIEVGRQAAEIRPGIPVLYASGYAEESVLRMGEDDPDFELLTKPFQRSALAAKVREVLDRARS